MDRIEKYVKYNEEHCVLICIEHEYCLSAGEGVGYHFRTFHKFIPFETRKQIIEYAKGLTLADPERIQSPDWDEMKIDGLKVVPNGFRCSFENCEGHVAATLRMMEEHCRNAHGWSKTDGPMWYRQALQSFYPGISSTLIADILGNHRKYFPVTLNSSENSSQMNVLMNALVKEASDRDEQHERQLDTVYNAHITTLTPWLRRTMWSDMFMGKDMNQLVELMGKPSVGETGLLAIWNATEKLVHKSFLGVKDCWGRGWSLIPFWLVSAHKNEESSKPFRIFYQDATIARYASYWQRLIVFCLRALLQDRSELGVQFRECQAEKLNELLARVELGEPTEEELEKMVQHFNID